MSLRCCGPETREPRVRRPQSARRAESRRCAYGDPDSTSGRAAAVAVEEEAEIRIEKIMDIRRQLGEGRYNIADRLDVVIDRIILNIG